VAQSHDDQGMTSTPPKPASSSRIQDTLRAVDEILRGHYTSDEALASGTVTIPVGTLLRVGTALGAIYGASLGTYALSHNGDRAWLQFLNATLKMPLLFLLTLLVTFPSLYVFAALLRSPLGRAATARLLLVVITVHLAVLASLGPVFAFFAVSTQSYHFLILLNVAFAATGGAISLVVLRRATNAMFRTVEPHQSRAGQRLLLTWCVVYGAVGAQMGWLLRPFLGAPGQPFVWLRGRDSSFFEAVLGSLRGLFGA
jgi:hypothetical protein